MTSSTTSQTRADTTTLVRGYTLALGVVAVFLALGAVSIYSTAENPTVDPTILWAFTLAARMNLAFAAITGLVALLRARDSSYAIGATTALNVLLSLLFPFGTAAFLYWWFVVRKRERAAAAA
jgi:hypothetical protein